MPHSRALLNMRMRVMVKFRGYWQDGCVGHDAGVGEERARLRECGWKSRALPGTVYADGRAGCCVMERACDSDDAYASYRNGLRVKPRARGPFK